MDRERFEPLARHANAALWATYGMVILGELRERSGRPALDEASRHRLALLAGFLEAAQRGALPVRDLRRRIVALAAPKQPLQRRSSLNRDLEAFAVVNDVLSGQPAGVGVATPGEQDICDWLTGALEVIDRVSHDGWDELTSSEREFLDERLMPALSRLASRTEEAGYAIRAPWHVVAV